MPVLAVPVVLAERSILLAATGPNGRPPGQVAAAVAEPHRRASEKMVVITARAVAVERVPATLAALVSKASSSSPTRRQRRVRLAQLQEQVAQAV
jgi:hypothetical protein